jgi:hypothetical protein
VNDVIHATPAFRSIGNPAAGRVTPCELARTRPIDPNWFLRETHLTSEVLTVRSAF